MTKQIVAKLRNYHQIVEVLKQEFGGTQPYTNPYIVQVDLPKGMGLKRLTRYLQPVDGVEIEKWDTNYYDGKSKLWIAVDEFDAEVVPNSTRTSDYFSTQPWDDHFCIKVQSLPGELAEIEVHEVQNVIPNKFKAGDKVRVRICYSNDTDYGRRKIVNVYK